MIDNLPMQYPMNKITQILIKTFYIPEPDLSIANI